MTSSTDDSRAASAAPRGTSNGTRASARVRLARTMRWATVCSETRNARDLLGRQAAEQAQGQRDARIGREHRVARDEHEAQEIVADVVEGRVDVHRGLRSLCRELATELL